jgi:hypothetical protein
MDAIALQTQAERFLTELRRSPQTVRAYRADLRHLAGWLGGYCSRKSFKRRCETLPSPRA